MSFTTKRRIVQVLLVLFMVWPLVHVQVVETYDVNPWRLFGWAMYCVPTYEPSVRVFGWVDDGSGELVLPPDPRVQMELELFIRQRGQVGDLASAEVLAAELFRVYPRLEGLTVAVSHPIYQRETASFESVIRRQDFRHRREETSAVSE